MSDQLTKLAALLAAQQDEWRRPPEVPEWLWGARTPGAVTLGLDHAGRRDALRRILLGPNSAHAQVRARTLSRELAMAGALRPGLLQRHRHLRCFHVKEPRAMGATSDRATTDLPGKRGPYPRLSELFRNQDTRSHAILFIDFVSHFLISPENAYVVLRNIVFAHKCYSELAPARLISLEAGLVCFDAILCGTLVCRYDDGVGQHQWLTAEPKRRAGLIRRRVNARKGVITPAARVRCRVELLRLLGVELESASPPLVCASD